MSEFAAAAPTQAALTDESGGGGAPASAETALVVASTALVAAAVEPEESLGLTLFGSTANSTARQPFMLGGPSGVGMGRGGGYNSPALGGDPAAEVALQLPYGASERIASMRRRPFARFLESPDGERVVEKLMPPPPSEPVTTLLGGAYQPPTDTAGFLKAFVGIALKIDACMTISDMSLPGNPLVYVNDQFCATTGYTREEALSRNCRFLQGPRTDPEAVETIVNALRTGTDCCVKLVNYRKDGSEFENLLLLRPVQDSNHVYRFCMGLCLEAPQPGSAASVVISIVYTRHVVSLRRSLQCYGHGVVALQVGQSPSRQRRHRPPWRRSSSRRQRCD